MAYPTLQSWIRGKPHLFSVRLDRDDSRVVRVIQRQAATAEKAILDMRPALVEGLDANGNVVRTWTVERESSLVVEEKQRRNEVDWPDEPQAMLARVITLACDAAAQRQEAVFRMAFDKLEALYSAQSSRLSSLEQQWWDAMTARALAAEEAAAAAEEELAEKEAQQPTTADQLVGTLVGVAAQKALNGAQKHD